MSERRSKILIFRDMLRTVLKKEKAKPTHILYGANLSHDRLKTYLNKLTKDGFIEKKDDGDRTYYIITMRGREFLARFKNIQEFSEAFGVDI